ncbi:glycerophosphodiester phosphodiesterase family protein [Bdellovibrio bacteriovorus]|uniref:glycerophosphodiester phosphodiesterase family protein n=1 Tax=Bdellovibrio bacteriovorus TaxID=959 RepID=UPI00045C0BC0|nr:glycerophosphodiester phosphodiesterase family protein [Bdellovibrio bacteriovorus]AHZ85308.1 hypothetical protein EP01_10215 [Bdellovibrio bacteriovorus]BEV69202.1 Glycerophosphodiester phosphodiesterase [Bdellovibrio bacteriovorus]
MRRIFSPGITLLLISAFSLPSFAQIAGPIQRRPFSGDTLGKNAVMCLIAKNMEVHGHRGIDGYPNNTVASFKAAYDAGADTAELDLMITGDDQIVTAHDPIPNIKAERCSLHGKSLEKAALRNMSSTEVAQIRCGERHFSEARTEPIPLLRDVFDAFKDSKVAGKPTRLNIEIKYFKDQVQYFPPEDQYLDLIIKEIRQSGWSQDRFFVQSFNHETLKNLKAKAPDIEVVPLIWDARGALDAATNLGSRLVTTGWPQLTPEVVFGLHQKGIRVVAWTPNTVEELKWVIASGADGVITDRADLFMKIRDELCE